MPIAPSDKALHTLRVRASRNLTGVSQCTYPQRSSGGITLQDRERDFNEGTPVMNARKHIAAYLLLGGLLSFQTIPALAQQNPASGASQGADRGGEHDFDWDIGTWKTHQRRLLHPLTGSTTWVDYTGTDVVRKIWDGANSGIIEADGPAGHLEIYTLRLYNSDTHQWNISFTSPGAGTLGTPVVGQFKNGRAEFFDQEAYNGKPILVRFSISGITPNSARFEQAFSSDWGRTWETNFIVSETKVE